MNEEWIDKKAKELREIFNNWIKSYRGTLEPIPASRFDSEHFIRSIVEECKPKVSNDWLVKFTRDVYLFKPTEKYPLYTFLKRRIKKIGVEVEG